MPSSHSPGSLAAPRDCVCQKPRLGPVRWFHGAVQNHAVLPDEFCRFFGNDGRLTGNARREEKMCPLGRAFHGLLNVLPGRYSDALGPLRRQDQPALMITANATSHRDRLLALIGSIRTPYRTVLADATASGPCPSLAWRRVRASVKRWGAEFHAAQAGQAAEGVGIERAFRALRGEMREQQLDLAIEHRGGDAACAS